MIDRLISSWKTNPTVSSVHGKSQSVILGWTRTALPSRLEQFTQENDIDYRKWEYGRFGTLFLLNSHPDIAHTDEAVAVKLGFARSESSEPLYAQDLLDRGLISPRDVDHKAIRGNTLALCVSQQEPAFHVYLSLVSTSQMYYWRDSDWVICSDTLRHLTAMVTPLELNPEAVPQHLVYRTVSGDMTYLKDIHKLLCGQSAKYWQGDWRLEQIERVDDWVPSRRFHRAEPEVVQEFNRQAEGVIGSYVTQATQPSGKLAMLLSGGVDSTLLASLVKSNLDRQQRLQSTSYIMRVSSFLDEVEYARYASDLLETEHRFIDVLPNDYPRLLEQTIDYIGHPISNEQDPCYLALAQFYANQGTRYFFSGTAIDTLLGAEDAKRLLQVEALRRIPGAKLALGFLGKALRRIWPNKAYGMREAAHALRAINDPLSLYHPFNYCTLTDVEAVQKCFDSSTIRRVSEYRLGLRDLYTSSSNLVEQTYLMVFTQALHEEEAGLVQVFQTHGLNMVTPYLDSELIKNVLAFEPHIRFYANGQAKWLPKQLVENRTHSKTTQWPKLFGGFDKELFEWMKHGLLRDMVCSIERPGYMSVADFEQKRDEPDWLTWNLLNLDLFQKRIVGASSTTR